MLVEQLENSKLKYSNNCVLPSCIFSYFVTVVFIVNTANATDSLKSGGGSKILEWGPVVA